MKLSLIVGSGATSGTNKPAKTTFLNDGSMKFKTSKVKTGASISSTGKSKAFNIVQPSLICNYIIRVK